MAAKRKCSGTNKKNAFFAIVVVAEAVLMLQKNWTLFLPQVNSEKVDLIVMAR